MKSTFRHRFAVLSCPVAIFLTVALSADAEDKSNSKRPQATVESAVALRKSGRYQAALDVLKKVESRRTLKAGTRQVIPLERALVYRARVISEKTLVLRLKDLKLAVTAAGEFLKNAPKHARAPEALRLKGKMLLLRIAALSDAIPNTPSKKERADHRTQAMKDVSEARAVLQQLLEFHTKEYRAFPKFIPAGKKAALQGRISAQIAMMEAQIELAKTTYWEAQVVPGGKEDRDELLENAAAQYGKIHAAYRTQIAGLYAQLWQGKCLLEHGQIGKAIGIFSALREHPSKHRFYVGTIRPQALQFQLACLNHKLRGDYFLVIDYAEKWLKKNNRVANTRTGTGIRWQLAIAHEQASKKVGIAARDKKKHRRDAIRHASFLTGSQSRHRVHAVAMIKRIGGAVPVIGTDFEEAFGVAQVNYVKLNENSSKLKKAKQSDANAATIAKLEQTQKRLADSTAQSLHRALKLADAKADAKKRNQARHLLAFVELKRDRPAVAQKLAMQTAREALKTDPQTARQSAYIAFAAAIKQHNHASPKEQPGIEKQIAEIGEFYIKNWPDTENAKSVRRSMGLIKRKKR